MYRIADSYSGFKVETREGNIQGFKPTGRYFIKSEGLGVEYKNQENYYILVFTKGIFGLSLLPPVIKSGLKLWLGGIIVLMVLWLSRPNKLWRK